MESQVVSTDFDIHDIHTLTNFHPHSQQVILVPIFILGAIAQISLAANYELLSGPFTQVCKLN